MMYVCEESKVAPCCNIAEYKNKNKAHLVYIYIYILVDEHRDREKQRVLYGASIRNFVRELPEFTYCFLRHIIGQILFALTLCVIFRMPSSQIYKYREVCKCLNMIHMSQMISPATLLITLIIIVQRDYYTLAVAASGQIT